MIQSFRSSKMSKTTCDVCFRQCSLGEGQTGFCKARVCQDGVVVSAGGYGCNLACPFCQNHSISLSEYSTDKYAGHVPDYEIISYE